MMFMRWPGRGDEQQAIQLALFVYFLCNNQMAGMNGIECTTIDTQPAGIHECYKEMVRGCPYDDYGVLAPVSEGVSVSVGVPESPLINSGSSSKPLGSSA